MAENNAFLNQFLDNNYAHKQSNLKRRIDSSPLADFGFAREDVDKPRNILIKLTMLFSLSQFKVKLVLVENLQIINYEVI